jgi:hypothetical protein
MCVCVCAWRAGVLCETMSVEVAPQVDDAALGDLADIIAQLAGVAMSPRLVQAVRDMVHAWRNGATVCEPEQPPAPPAAAVLSGSASGSASASASASASGTSSSGASSGTPRGGVAGSTPGGGSGVASSPSVGSATGVPATATATVARGQSSAAAAGRVQPSTAKGGSTASGRGGRGGHAKPPTTLTAGVEQLLSRLGHDHASIDAALVAYVEGTSLTVRGSWSVGCARGESIAAGWVCSQRS